MPQMLMSVLTIGAVVTEALGAWVSAAAAMAVGVGAAWAFSRVRGTTLAAPAVWAVLSASVNAVVEIAAATSAEPAGSLTFSLGRYAAAVSTFCPLMAVLGAKRPQDRGWQWVVLSLWVILLVPAMQTVAARSGEQLDLFVAWRALLWILLAMGLLNYLPTRYASPALMTAAGQAMLLAPYLLDGTLSAQWRPAAFVSLLAATLLASAKASARSRRDDVEKAPEPPPQDFNQRWFAFRDGWGAFWGLRILQRVNQTAELSQWPVRLEWGRGFVTPTSSSGRDHEREIDRRLLGHIEQSLDSLLRRFERVDST